MTDAQSLLALAGAGITGGLLARGQSAVASGKTWVLRRTTGQVMVQGDAYHALAGEIGNIAHDDRSIRFGDATVFVADSNAHSVARLADGTRVVRIEGHKVIVRIEREKFQNAYLETMSLTVKVKDFAWLRAWVAGTIEAVQQQTHKGLPVFVSRHGWWSLALRRPLRPLSSVVHPDDVPRKIIEAVTAWQATEDRILAVGENFHLGFLLHGPPGSGKTSTAIAVASALRRPLYVLAPSLTSAKEDGGPPRDSLPDLMLSLPPGCVLLVEEVEQFFPLRRGQPRDAATALALSLFDGPLSKHNVVRIYTTNHPESLDPAFLRAGRCDFSFAYPDRQCGPRDTMFAEAE